jgi:Tfp pilus assembly protein PilN
MKAVNLIPGERRGKSRDLVGRSGGGALAVLVLIAGLAVLALVYGSARHQISSQAGEAASLTAQTNAIEARTGRLSSYSSFVAMAEQRMKTVSQLVESRFDWSHALHELGRVMPAGTSLDSLHGTAGAKEGATVSSSSSSSSSKTTTSATSSTPPGSTPAFTLSGCATSQSVVAQTLQRLRLMDGVSEVQLQSSTSSSSSSSGSSGGGEGSSSGGCPPSDPTFSVQVGFAALPAAPALSAPAGVTTAAAHGRGVKEQTSERGRGASR